MSDDFLEVTFLHTGVEMKTKEATAVTTLTQPEPKVHDLYRNYKGGEYLVLGVGVHSETKEKMVVYASLTYGTIWTRPLEIWNQFVTDPKDPEKLVQRFARIERRSK